MFDRFLLIAFYTVSVTLFSWYLYLGNVLNELLLEDVVPLGQTFEYIIVGAGTAGLTIAATLPASHSHSVLLLEAGPSRPHVVHDIPLFAPLLQGAGSAFDWSRRTVAQAPFACGALNEARSRWPAGRGFGGSQILNNMLWTRGHPDDYSAWFGGAYDYGRDVQPHFEAAEALYGLERLAHRTPLAAAFINASAELGLAGAFEVPLVTQRRGARCTNAHFVDEQQQQQQQPRLPVGLQTVLGAHVKRLLFDDVDREGAPRVVGVLYERSGRLVRVYCRRGVVLSAGTIGSPAILLASGIGPKTDDDWSVAEEDYGQERAEQSGNATSKNASASAAASTATAPPPPPMLPLPPKQPQPQRRQAKAHQPQTDGRRYRAPALRVHLPGVGQNLQDHVTTGIDLLLLRQPLGIQPWDLITPGSLLQYVQSGSGPLTMCGCEALGFVATAAPNRTQPDIGFMVLPLGATADGGTHLRHLLDVNATVWQRYFEPLVGRPTASILPVVLHPQSRGRVYRGRHGEMRIDPRYLSDGRDVDALVRGLRVLEQLLEQPAMRRLGVELNAQPFPGCEALEFRTTAYWRCYVRQMTMTAFHPVGTCRMGADPAAAAAAAVVGFDYRVHGTRGVWVVDASVMPTLPSGNPNAAVAMLAKRFVEQQQVLELEQRRQQQQQQQQQQQR